MVDSVGGGGGDAHATRRRALEEQRNKRLEEIEEQYEKNVDRVKRSRDKSVEEIYRNQIDDVEGIKEASEERVRKLRENAMDRVADFQKNMATMTKHAQKQYQSKLQSIEDNYNDLQKQREFMVKRHTESMDQLRDNQAHLRTKLKNRFNQEAGEIYLTSKAQTADLRLKGELEEKKVRAENRAMIDGLRTDAKYKMRQLQNQTEKDQNSLRSQLDFIRNSGGAQLQEEMEAQRIRRDSNENEHLQQMSRMNRDFQQKMNREAIKGKKAVSDTRNLYMQQVMDMRKQHRNTVRNAENQNQKVVNHIKFQGKLEKHLAVKEREAQAADQARASAEQDKLLKEKKEKMRELHAKDIKTLNDDFRDQRRMLIETEVEQTQRDLKFLTERGQKQLNDQKLSNKEMLGNYAARKDDPFYSVHKMDIQYENTPEQVTIELNIPEHEHESIRVSESNDHLSISGTRRNKATAFKQDGQRVDSHSYQSFSETFPVNGKLKMAHMVRDYQDGKLKIKIPKG